MPAQKTPLSGEPPRPSAGTKNPAANPLCPNCQGRMTVKQIAPVLFASNLDDMVFGCEQCGSEVKRTVKRA